MSTARPFNPFLMYSDRLQVLLSKAAKQKDPAWWLYKNDGRTVLFMLEALTRLHYHTFGEKVFDKWNRRFKKLEDLLGEVDEYAALEETLKSDSKVPREALKYMDVNKKKFLVRTNRRLNAKDWLKDKLLTFDKKIGALNLVFDETYITRIRAGLQKEVEAILSFAKERNYRFTKVEDEVHELRRKLRWLSIYVQAMQGMIQLKKSAKRKKYQQQYFTKAILESPYNKVPARPQAPVAILDFDSDSFFALSWLISELGKLKDHVLNEELLRDAIYVSRQAGLEEAAAEAGKIMGLKPSVEVDVLKQASVMLKTAFTKDKVLDSLIA